MGIKNFREKYRLSPEQTKVAITSAIVGISVATSVLWASFTLPQNRELERLHELVKVQNEKVEHKDIPDTKQFRYSPITNEGIVFVVPKTIYQMQVNSDKRAFTSTNIYSYMTADSIIDELTKKVLQAPEASFIAFTGETPLTDYMRLRQFRLANVEYARDTGYGYAQTPLETLVKGRGDCEDLTILDTAMFRSAGRRVCIIKDYSNADNEMQRILTASFMDFDPEQEQQDGHVTLAVGLHPQEPCPAFNIIYKDREPEVDYPHVFDLDGTTFVTLNVTSKTDKFFLNELPQNEEGEPIKMEYMLLP